ncbi:MAG: hypothetical protein VSS75_017265, partial [Candidatus Parabeggiatoa sp.]|nr:hypothetical protein [Candidatus Parabeggiatoa sp.]
MTLTTPKRCLLSTLVLLLLTFFNMVSAHEQSSDNYTMIKNVLSNGGNKSNSPNYQLVATLGQNATQKSTANGKVLYSGFYAPMGTQQPIISGTVLNEDTDAGLKDWTVKLEPIGNGDIITTLTDA